MKKLCKFAVLRYVPNEERGEFINIGFVFHSPEDKFIDIKITTNFSRVSSFDDEIDISLLKLILEGVKEQFSQTLTSGPSESEVSDINFLEKQTKFYVNQLQFSEISSVFSENIEDDFFNYYQAYVYFDVHRKQRITDFKMKSLMNRVLKQQEVYNDLEKDLSYDVGTDRISIDYAYTSHSVKKFMKTFSFDYTSNRSVHATQTAKEWAYNFSKLKNRLGYKADFLSLVYIDESRADNKNIINALKILNEETKTISAHHIQDIEAIAKEISKELKEDKNKDQDEQYSAE